MIPKFKHKDSVIDLISEKYAVEQKVCLKEFNFTANSFSLPVNWTMKALINVEITEKYQDLIKRKEFRRFTLQNSANLLKKNYHIKVYEKNLKESIKRCISFKVSETLEENWGKLLDPKNYPRIADHLSKNLITKDFNLNYCKIAKTCEKIKEKIEKTKKPECFIFINLLHSSYIEKSRQIINDKNVIPPLKKIKTSNCKHSDLVPINSINKNDPVKDFIKPYFENSKDAKHFKNFMKTAQEKNIPIPNSYSELPLYFPMSNVIDQLHKNETLGNEYSHLSTPFQTKNFDLNRFFGEEEISRVLKYFKKIGN